MNSINSDKRISYAVTVFALLTLLSTLLAPGKYIRWTSVVALLTIAAMIFFLVKKRSILSYYKRNVLIIMLISSALYLMLYYLCGLHFGFGSTLMKLSFPELFAYAFPITLIILLSEYIRTALEGQKSKLISILTYTVCVITDVIIAGGVLDISTSYRLTDFVGLTLLPALTSNFLFNYVSKRYGMWPCAAYRMIITLYAYLIPFVPNVPTILNAFVLLMLPLIILILIDFAYEKKKRVARERKGKLRFVFPTILVIIMISFVMLVSCKFRYGILVIASPSMTGEINIGDAVIYEDYEYCDEAEENDVIVFTTDSGKKIVHRIIETQTINGQKQYITKGDANEDPDVGFITDENIVGIVHTKVLYIGYPSLWLHEIFD